MLETIRDYWPAILIAVLILAIAAAIFLRPRQRVQLSQSIPLRPHMAHKAPPARGEGRGLAAEVAAAASDVTGDIIEAPVHANLPGAAGPPDDLQRLKGVGPKFAQILNARGIVRFEQLARLTGAEIDLLDDQMGPFRGRLQRDRIIEQADYLARGDGEGFEARFGKL